MPRDTGREQGSPRVNHLDDGFDPDIDLQGSSPTRRRREATSQRMRNYSGFDSPWSDVRAETYERLHPRAPDLSYRAGEDRPYPGSSWSYAEGNRFMGPDSGRRFYGKGPKNWKRSDARIREDVCDALYQSWEVDASDIEVDVEDGTVYLRGNISSRRTKRRAEETVEFISGVHDVINELRID